MNTLERMFTDCHGSRPPGSRWRPLIPVLLGLSAVGPALAFPSMALAASYATGFSESTVYNGLTLPVGLAMAPDGSAYVTEKAGQVWHIETAGAPNANRVLDLRDEVNGLGDRGLLGIALDPDFANNRYLYLLYTVDPIAGAPDEAADSVTWARLTRFTLTANGLSVRPGSRTVLLGDTAASGFPICYTTHTIGTLQFLTDGTLLASAGDGAHYDYYTDAGQNETATDADCEAMFGASQDVGAYRSQHMESLAGKLLRLNPANGQGLSDNPFYTGNPADVRSRIFASGLRNPWRITAHPTSDVVWLGDVGAGTFEELSVAVGGENFGWPCYEGFSIQNQYFAADPSSYGCDTLETTINPGLLTAPVLSWHHGDPAQVQPAGIYVSSSGTTASSGFTGSTAMGGAFYLTGTYPSSYRGKLFFSDFSAGWIKVGTTDTTTEQLLQVNDFATGIAGMADIKTHPLTGDLYYVSLYNGALMHIQYSSPAQQPPTVSASATPLHGSAPLPVQFSSAGSSDPDGGILTYVWEFGDGSTSNSANPSHTYAQEGIYSARLRVIDDEGASALSPILTVEVANEAPVVQILSPLEGSTFTLPSQFYLKATASDDQTPASQLHYRWSVYLHHNEHYHPDYVVVEGAEATFELQSIDENGYLEIRLEVTDGQGLTTTAITNIYPSNQGPVFEPVANQTISAGTALVLPIDVSDPEGDLVYLDAISLPPGATFGADQVLRWTPTDAQSGVYTATFRAIDENPAPMTAELSVVIQVLGSGTDAMTVVITGDWGAGFCADLHWRNNLGATVSTWSAELSLTDAVINGGWNGHFTATSGGYHITPEDYNAVLKAGDELVVGFCADGAGRPTGALIRPVLQGTTPPPTGASVSVTWQSGGGWPGGSCGTMVLVNEGTATVNGWGARFDLPVGTTVTALWSGNYSTSGQTWHVTDVGWNAALPPGGSQSFGMCLSGNGNPQNILYEPRNTFESGLAWLLR